MTLELDELSGDIVQKKKTVEIGAFQDGSVGFLDNTAAL